MRSRANDPHCRGVLLLGLEAPEAELRRRSRWRAATRSAKASPSAGRSSAQPAEDWLAGRINDQQAIQAMAAGYRRLIDGWERAA